MGIAAFVEWRVELKIKVALRGYKIFWRAPALPFRDRRCGNAESQLLLAKRAKLQRHYCTVGIQRKA